MSEPPASPAVAPTEASRSVERCFAEDLCDQRIGEDPASRDERRARCEEGGGSWAEEPCPRERLIFACRGADPRRPEVELSGLYYGDASSPFCGPELPAMCERQGGTFEAPPDRPCR